MGTEKLLFRLEQPHGMGDIYIAWQKGSGSYIATTGVDAVVNIFDRRGQIFERIRLQGFCTGFGWDADGDLLGIICQSPQLMLWDANSNKKQVVDIGLKDTYTCLLWAKTSALLAVGTLKGNVAIYNHATSKRIPIIGKHSKKISCGAWNTENLLALGSEDKSFSISNTDGDTVRVVSLRAEPSEIQFSEMKLDERLGGEHTVSLIIGKRTLYLYNMLDPENPIELAFQQHYGSIVTYKWFGDGYILIGFSNGYFIAISTHIKEVGQELFQVKNHKTNLTDIAVCESISKVASCGDNVIKVHDLTNLQETYSVLSLAQETGIERIGWSVDGQLLAVCTRNGSLNVYVSSIPMISAVSGPRIAILSSLAEVSLYNFKPDMAQLTPTFIKLEAEPTFIAVGPYNLSAGLNNRAWFYDLTKSKIKMEEPFITERQYLGIVQSIKLSVEYASVLYEGKIQLHMIEQPDVAHEDRETIMFPNVGLGLVNDVITCHAITTDFLIYATDMGQIVYFSVEDWAVANDYKHSVGIVQIFNDPAGSRLIFLDVKGQVYVYNAVNNDVDLIPKLPSTIIGAIWDSNLTDRNIFILYNEHEIITYVYLKLCVYGSTVKSLGSTKLVSKQMPLFMYSGEVILASSGGLLTPLILSSHNCSHLADKDSKTLEENLKKQLALQWYVAAWNTCSLLQSKDSWKELAREALINLELELALRAYRQCEDVALVAALEEIINIQDVKLISGYILMYLNEHDRAQIAFLNSSCPTSALEMRRDLLQWDQALQLAKKMAPDQIPYISREYAQQLEFLGNYAEAYLHFEKGLHENVNTEHIFICKCGIARTSIRCSNYKHGVNIALELNNKQLYKECAEALESKKQLADAALLYEKSQMYDKAASNYIKFKNWMKVGELLPHITSNKIHLEYAKAKEKEGRYEEAANVYYAAKDFDSVIRLQLEHLNNAESAVELVQETKSVEGAKLVAKFFQGLNDYPSAIRFLVLSHCQNEAFELARKHGKLQLYGDILLNTLSADELRPQDFTSLAIHFENESNNFLAGKYYYHAREYRKALKLLLNASKSNSMENEAITIAIDVIASSNDDHLAAQLIEFLLGEFDGLPKDPKYLFRLYMARKQFRDASKSAIIIASEEQKNGNYRNAHDILFSMYQELKNNNIKIPYEMHWNLMLLHSYILVRLHVRNGDHVKAARMLIRVSNNISKFPSHIVPILTSTVIECHRAGLKSAAFKYAAMLIQNTEYRKQIDPKYAKKIEGVVRKPPRNGKSVDSNSDSLELATPCPYCEVSLLESEIVCDKCKNNIPFCIVTGKHIVKTDLTACPDCDFPALYSEFLGMLKTEAVCPMCSEKVDSRKLLKIEDTGPYLNIE